MRPTPIELRKRVVAARTEDGQSMGQIAERFRIPKGTVQRILERYRDSGSVEPKPQNPGRKSAFSSEDLARLKEDILAHQDATLEELRERSSVNVSIVSFHKVIKKLGFTRKKSLYAIEQKRADVALRRDEFLQWLRCVDPRRLVFLDETGAKTNMTRMYGRAQKGERVLDYAPHRHWKTTTLVAAITCESAIASMVLDGPMDRLSFEAYVAQVLIPELPNNAIVVMDNYVERAAKRLFGIPDFKYYALADGLRALFIRHPGQPHQYHTLKPRTQLELWDT